MKKTVAYTRVSTDGQANDGAGLDTQKERIEAFCVSQGWTLGATYTDAGESGAKLSRPALDELRGEIEQGNIERIVVYKLDRLSRYLGHLIQLVDDELNPAGVSLASVTEPIDTTTPAGMMIFQMLGTFAEFERKLMTERLDGGRRTRASQGKKASGAMPYGYKQDGEAIVPDPITAPIVKRIFSEYLSAGSLGRLKKSLDADGITNERKKPFTRASLAYILNNRFYVGEVTYGEVITEGAHKAIISKNMFGRVQNSLSTRNKHRAVA